MSLTREQLSLEIIEAGRFLYGRGWSPATSSNYSTRLSASQALLTVSGKHKGQLGPNDVLATDLMGNSLEPGKKPSAETLLHTQLYSWRAGNRRGIAHPFGECHGAVADDAWRVHRFRRL